MTPSFLSLAPFSSFAFFFGAWPFGICGDHAPPHWCALPFQWWYISTSRYLGLEWCAESSWIALDTLRGNLFVVPASSRRNFFTVFRAAERFVRRRRCHVGDRDDLFVLTEAQKTTATSSSEDPESKEGPSAYDPLRAASKALTLTKGEITKAGRGGCLWGNRQSCAGEVFLSLEPKWLEPKWLRIPISTVIYQ